MHEKILNIFSHLRNANEYCFEIPSHPSWDGCRQENKWDSSKNTGTEEPLFTASGLWTSTVTMQISAEVSPKAETELSYDPAIPLLGIFLENSKSTDHTDIAHPDLLLHYLQ